MYCQNCGSELSYGAKFCSNCGMSCSSKQTTGSSYSSNPGENENISEKSRLVACLLAFFLGGLGIHSFYAGKIKIGAAQIALSCFFGLGCIWALVDFILIVCGTYKDDHGKLILNWN